MSSNENLQLSVPVAANTTYVSSVSDLLHMNSMSFSALYEHPTLPFADLKMYFSDDGVNFVLYRTQQLLNTITKDGNLVIPKRYFKFQIENPEPDQFSATKIFYYVFSSTTQNISVNLDSDDQITIPGVAQESTQLLVKNAVVATNGKITACNTGATVISSSVLPAGASTSVLQTNGNTKLTNIETNLTRVVPTDNAVGEALPVRLMVGHSGSAFNALRAIGQDLAVHVTDMEIDVSLNSGLSTKVLQESTKLVIDKVETGLNKNRINDTIYTNATVILNAVSSSISLGDGENRYNTIQIIGNSTTALYKFILQYSIDGTTNWYSDGAENAVYNNGSEYEFSVSRVNISSPFVRVKSTVAGNSVNLVYSLTKE